MVKNSFVYVEKNLKETEFGMSFIGQVNNQNILFKTNKIGPLFYGQKIDINSASCELITNRYNNPSSFDYVQYMKTKKVTYSCKLNSYNLTQKRKQSLNTTVRNIRELKVKQINQNYPKSGKVINALFLGYKDFDQDFNNLASETGISHLLAISGTHLIVIIFIYQTILFNLGFSQRQVGYSLFIILPIYLILCGESSSASRVITVELLSIAFPKYTKIQILKFVTCMYLFINCHLIYAVGFQLSYLISFFLYKFGGQIEQKSYFKGIIKSSITIYIITFPISINLNNTVNPLFFISNLLLIPLLNFFLLPIAILLNFTPRILFIDNILSIIFTQLNIFLLYIDQFSFNVGSFSQFDQFIYYTIVIRYLYFKTPVYKQKILTIFLVISFLPIAGSFNLIDVGQGDSILIELPFNKTSVLIDTGSTTAEAEIISFLKSKGINHLDYVIITHWHEDHYGNLEKIADEFKPSVIYARNIPQNLFTNLTIHPIPQNFSIKYGKFNLKYYPCSLVSENENNNSLIFKFSFGKLTGLLMGDAEAEQEQDFLSQYNLLPIDFLKVGHHGSKTSSTDELLYVLQPKLSLISSGKNNRFHHPAPDTVSRLKKYSKLVHDTQEKGIFRFNFLFDYIW